MEFGIVLPYEEIIPGNFNSVDAIAAMVAIYKGNYKQNRKITVMNLQLTIILPVYNVQQYLPQCFDSIVSEVNRYKEKIEVLMIDDGSTDESGKVADAYADRNPFFKVIHQPNRGVAAARNTGMELAHGEWLYFVDSDDWLAKGCIFSIYKSICEYQDADIIMFDAFQNAESKELKWEHFDDEAVWQDKESIRKLQRGMLYFPGADKKTKVPLAAPWDKLYRRLFLQGHHLRFREELEVLDDMIFNMEAFGAASKIIYCKKRIYHYRHVSDSITNSYKPDRVVQDMKVWHFINHYMQDTFRNDNWEVREKEAFLQAYYCRVIKSFSICCRLCFFHQQNEKNTKDKIRYVKQVLKLTPYREAFNKVRIREAEWRLKAVILMGRSGAGCGIYLLHLADMWSRHMRRLVTGMSREVKG